MYLTKALPAENAIGPQAVCPEMHYDNARAIHRDFSPVKIENFRIKILIFFLIFAQNIDCWYTLEPPRRGGSNEYQQSMF